MPINIDLTTDADHQIRDEFLKPLEQIFPQLESKRKCQGQSDEDWIRQGIWRVLTASRSGRDFIQTFLPLIKTHGIYFNRLASDRRLSAVVECSQKLRAQVDQMFPSELAQFDSLKDFEIYAGDGHYLEHATHDGCVGETYWPTGHFFALNIKSQSLFPLELADFQSRKKEHDQRALKRQSVKILRQGAGNGRKVIWVWDKAGVNLELWKIRKASGIYFLSMQKDNQCLDLVKEREIDFSQAINAGVQSDRVMKDRRGIEVRQVIFENPLDGKRYIYLTNEMTLAPGLIALLYKTRWEIEKVFDETKTKLQETKSWATSSTAKQMQSHFVSMTHNLLLLFNHFLKTEKGIENVAEIQRRQSREKQQDQTMNEISQPVPLIYRIFNRFTQASFKLIRWLRVYWQSVASQDQAYEHLRALYAKL